MKIAIAGTGCIGLSTEILLSQHNNEKSVNKLLLSPDPLDPTINSQLVTYDIKSILDDADGRL